MKAIICLLAVVAGANAGFLKLGLDALGLRPVVPLAPVAPVAPGQIYAPGYSAGPAYASGYGGYSRGVVPVSKIIKVIEAPLPVLQSAPVQVVQPGPVQVLQPAPVPIVESAPVKIIKIIHEPQPILTQPIVESAPVYKIIKIIEKPALGW